MAVVVHGVLGLKAVRDPDDAQSHLEVDSKVLRAGNVINDIADHANPE